MKKFLFTSFLSVIGLFLLPPAGRADEPCRISMDRQAYRITQGSTTLRRLYGGPSLKDLRNRYDVLVKTGVCPSYSPTESCNLKSLGRHAALYRGGTKWQSFHSFEGATNFRAEMVKYGFCSQPSAGSETHPSRGRQSRTVN